MKLFNRIAAGVVLLLIIPGHAYTLFCMGYGIHTIILVCGGIAVAFALLLNIRWVGLKNEEK